MSTTHATITNRTDDAKTSSVTLTVEITPEALATYREKTLAHLKKDIALDGFRKGHVPDDILVRHIGEGALLQETADTAISEELPLLLAKETIPAIAAPKVTVTKLAPGNPLCFTATIEILPEVKLPDYKEIAKKLNAGVIEEIVDEKEVQDVLTRLKRERTRIAHIEEGKNPEEAQELSEKAEEKDLKDIDDEFVKGLGYESVDDFTTKLRTNILEDKKARAKDKNRNELIEAIAEKVEVAVPETLISEETHKMEAQFADDLARAGLTFDEYLKRTEKTHDDIHKEWREPAAKRAKVQLILNEIAVKEQISAPEDELAKHVAHTKEHHKDIPEDRIRAYYAHILRNDAVIRFLEGVK